MNNETPRILKPDDDAILKLAEHLPPIKCNILCVHTYRNNVKYDLNLWLDGELEKYTRIYNVDSKFVFSPDDLEVHPEDYCQQCGGPNPTWYVGNELWNTVNGSPNGIICPQCFEKKAEEKGIAIIFNAKKI